MKIVELDGYAANPGDISWDAWHNIQAPDGSMCEFIQYDRTPAEKVIERAKDAEILITNKVVFSSAVIEQLPHLRYIGVLATGYNVVDIEAAHKKGITVTNIPAYSTASVAQLVMAHLLHITNNVSAHDTAVHQGQWASCPDFTFSVSPQFELDNKIFGIIGLGNIGMAVAHIAHAMGMHILAFTSKEQPQLPPFIRKADTLDELFQQADVLSLHCPLTPDTHHIVNTRTLSLMKPTAIIINTGRGPLIDEQALTNALNNNDIYAAGIDVLEEEPPTNGSPLLTARNCHITPHIAWASLAARQRLMNIAINNIKAFLKGTPINVV